MKINLGAFRYRTKLTAKLDNASRPVRRIWPRLSDALLGLLALLVVLFVLSTYSTTLACAASKLVSGNQYLALADGLVNPYRNRHLLLNSGLPIYDLKVKRSEMLKVEDAIERAKKQGWMSDDMKVWVPGTFFYEGQRHNVKLRVHGDLPNHWSGPKKSWAIKFCKEKIDDDGKVTEVAGSLNGRRRINLILPIDREFAVAPFVNSLMRDAGLTVPRDQFVILRINGAVQGLYYEIEDCDTSMLAAQRRPETTTIFGQNNRSQLFEQYTKLGTPAASDAKYDIGSMKRDVDKVGEMAMRAMQVLIDHSLNPTPENFKRVRTVLDWEPYLRFRNMTTLCNTNHVRFGSDNFKVHYDQSRGLLEPLPWDLHLTRLPKEPGTIDFFKEHGPDEIERATLTDPELRLQRNRLMWELVKDGGHDFMAKFDAIHDRIRPIAWADVLSTPIEGHKMDVDRQNLDYNVRRTYKVLNTSSANVTYRLAANDLASIDVAATSFSGIKLREIHISDPSVIEGEYRLFEDANNNGQIDDDDPLVAEATASSGKLTLSLQKLVLPGVKYGGSYIGGHYWEYFDTLTGRQRFLLTGKLVDAKRDLTWTGDHFNPLKWTAPTIDVDAVNAVTDQAIPSALASSNKAAPGNSIGITAYNASDPYDIDAPEYTLAQFLAGHPDFAASQEFPGAAELSGSVTISGAIIVPKAVPLVLRPGTDITMKPSASILSYGGLIALGTSEEWIRIHDDGTGDPWGTFAVVRAPSEVQMEYVDIQGGGQARVNGIFFTGGLAVYETDIRIEHCRIHDMKSEDGINLKNARIMLKDCLISNTASDLLDLDFCTGEIRDCVFINSGRATDNGDGADISGSSVTIAGNRFENCADKGISVGENSYPIIVNNLFLRCNIGISCKDLSHPKVAYCTFVENKQAIDAKRKKEWYGGGEGEFVDCVFVGNKGLLHEDYFSRGKVRVDHSLLDQEVHRPTCQTGRIEFADPEHSDFRLRDGLPDGARFDVARPEWAAIGSQEPQVPGVFAKSPIVPR